MKPNKVTLILVFSLGLVIGFIAMQITFISNLKEKKDTAAIKLTVPSPDWSKFDLNLRLSTDSSYELLYRHYFGKKGKTAISNTQVHYLMPDINNISELPAIDFKHLESSAPVKYSKFVLYNGCITPPVEEKIVEVLPEHYDFYSVSKSFLVQDNPYTYKGNYSYNPEQKTKASITIDGVGSFRKVSNHMYGMNYSANISVMSRGVNSDLLSTNSVTFEYFYFPVKKYYFRFGLGGNIDILVDQNQFKLPSAIEPTGIIGSGYFYQSEDKSIKMLFGWSYKYFRKFDTINYNIGFLM